MILRFFPDFPQTYQEEGGFLLTGGLLWYPRRSLAGVTCLFLISLYIYKYIHSPFYFRFVSRHNTNHRGNGEATAHVNQAFGVFWSRVTPAELLYIWLSSFDELRLAMNALLPVVRPLLCYAPRGATPMHKKKHASDLLGVLQRFINLKLKRWPTNRFFVQI